MSLLVSYFLFLSYFFLFYVIMFKIFSKKNGMIIQGRK